MGKHVVGVARLSTRFLSTWYRLKVGIISGTLYSPERSCDTVTEAKSLSGCIGIACTGKPSLTHTYNPSKAILFGNQIITLHQSDLS